MADVQIRFVLEEERRPGHYAPQLAIERCAGNVIRLRIGEGKGHARYRTMTLDQARQLATALSKEADRPMDGGKGPVS